MTKNLLKHLGYYFSLIAIFAVGLFLTLISYPNRSLEIFVIIATIIFYVVWGILHHLYTHELTAKIMVEYILIGILGLSVIFFIFMGGVGI